MTKRTSHEQRDFEAFMFGRQPQPKQKEETTEEKKTDTSFDFVDTTETLMQTYRQLSPYIKELSALFKKTK
ncbi:hypothetical protein N780_03375 [Pontibacillus chungwhensis BH030062]|uniref:Uncharacterized protein n=1 Tax=Pontibacillus chungwhensis BH030062 TaxID=1385513 RepID=A0A0A2UWD8_9BACI|nr:hypothetical protein [Pontibacillus chungwhensis]KGP90801.1 hypothetical protein N780_03375 [Pontibacillus chungwhensis BH030062]